MGRDRFINETKGKDLDALHRAIVRGETEYALDLLYRLEPSHDFLSISAERMLAAAHGQKALI